jgi:hypothetical protein
MQRRALLSTVAATATAALAGCTGQQRPRSLASGTAKARPIDEPFMRHGMTADSDQYVYARLYHEGDGVATVDGDRGDWLSRAVDDLGEQQLGILTNLRTGAGAPAYLWPDGTKSADGRLHVGLSREELGDSAAVEGEEAVGVAFAVYDFEGDPPQGLDVVLPSGATMSLGSPSSWW